MAGILCNECTQMCLNTAAGVLQRNSAGIKPSRQIATNITGNMKWVKHLFDNAMEKTRERVHAILILEKYLDILTYTIKHKDIHQREQARVARALFNRKLRGNPIWQQRRIGPSLLSVKRQDRPATAPLALCNIAVWNYTHTLSAWVGRNHSD